MSSKILLFWTGILLTQFRSVIFADAAGEWNLVIAHSNDLWYQLDEIQGDDKPCYSDLPPVTSTTTLKPTETPNTSPSISTTNEGTSPSISTPTTTTTPQDFTISVTPSSTYNESSYDFLGTSLAYLLLKSKTF